MEMCRVLPHEKWQKKPAKQNPLDIWKLKYPTRLKMAMYVETCSERQWRPTQ
jgi:hypothetical protein